MNASIAHFTQTATRPAPAVEPMSLYGLAKEALHDADNDAERATKSLSERLLSDAPLLRMLIESAVNDAVYASVGMAVRNGRASILRAISQPPALNGEAIKNVMRLNLLDFALAGGLPLRDATREEVSAQVDRYSSQADDMAHKARWLRLVAAATPARKRVGQALSAAEVARMFEETVL